MLRASLRPGEHEAMKKMPLPLKWAFSTSRPCLDLLNKQADFDCGPGHPEL
jgi:hypothetical protein